MSPLWEFCCDKSRTALTDYPLGAPRTIRGICGPSASKADVWAGMMITATLWNTVPFDSSIMGIFLYIEKSPFILVHSQNLHVVLYGATADAWEPQVEEPVLVRWKVVLFTVVPSILYFCQNYFYIYVLNMEQQMEVSVQLREEKTLTHHRV